MVKDNLFMWCLPLVLMFLFLSIPVEVDSIRYFIISVTLLFYYVNLSRLKVNVIVSRIELLFLLFIIVNFVSVFFATNINMAINSFNRWLILLLVLIASRYWPQSKWRIKPNINLVVKFISLFTLGQLLIFLFNILTLDKSDELLFNSIMGNNSNYLSVYILCLAFVSYCIGAKRLALALSIVLIFISIKFKVIGVLIPCFVFLIHRYQKILRAKYKFILAAVFIGIAFSFLSTVWQYELFDYQSRSLRSFRSRIIDLIISTKLFISNPILGVGSGNWKIEAYQYDFNDLAFYLRKLQLDNHNLISRIFAETGLLGFGALVGFIYLQVRKISQLSFSENRIKRFVNIPLLYVIVSNYYLSATCSDFHFSQIELLSFIVLGLLNSCQKECKKSQIKIFNKVAIILSVFLSAYYLFFNLNFFVYNKMSSQYDQSPTRNVLTEVEDRYNRIWFSSIGNIDIGYNLATKYESHDLQKANFYFLESLKSNPHNSTILYDYILFLKRQKNYSEIIRTVEKFAPFNSEPMITAALIHSLSEIGDFEKMIPYLEILKKSRYQYRYDGLCRYYSFQVALNRISGCDIILNPELDDDIKSIRQSERVFGDKLLELHYETPKDHYSKSIVTEHQNSKKRYKALVRRLEEIIGEEAAACLFLNLNF